MKTVLPSVCVADRRFLRLSAARGPKRQPEVRDHKQPLRWAPWQMGNSPALKTCLELEAASERATVRAVSRKRSLLHPSLLAPGAFSLRYKVTEAAVVHPPHRAGMARGSRTLGWALR